MMRSLLLAPLCALLAASCFAESAPPHAGPTAQEVIEFERIAQPSKQGDDQLNEQVSPDGTRAFVLTRKADVASDTNRYRIQLFDVTPAHLAARRVPSPDVVFSLDASRDNSYYAQAIKNVQWLDDRTLVFLARRAGETFQVFGLDVVTRELTPLTHEKDVIVSFAVSRDLRRVVYAVQVLSLIHI